MTDESVIKFKTQSEALFATKLSLNETLFNIRIKLRNDLPKGSSFIYQDGTKILKKDENKFTLKDIAKKENHKKNYIVYLDIIEDNYDQEEETHYSRENQSNDENNERSSSSRNEEISTNLNNYPTNDISNLYSILEFSINTTETKKKHKYNSLQDEIYKNKNLNDAPNANQLAQDRNKSLYFHKNFEKFYEEDLSNFKCIEKIGELNICLYPSVHFEDTEELNALSIMVVGKTGSGKTSLLNSFVNSLLGVEYEDNYRFKIISEKSGRSQAYSQTDKVNYYNIRSIEGYPPMKIIDTPGYEDTRGLKKDEETTSQIKELFEKEISYLNAVCFVTKSSDNRLTNSQKYILNKILDLFGEDIKENFIFMMPFCDNNEPNIIKPLQEKDSPFSEIIKTLKDSPWYFKFNNPVIFDDNRTDEVNQKFWKLNMENFDKLKKKLRKLPRKCLKNTREVLKQRIFLEEQAKILSIKLKERIDNIEELKEIIKIVKSLKDDLKDCQNFTKTIKQVSTKKIPKKNHLYATTCLICSKTCHNECYISDDSKKMKCSAMNKEGYCIYCPKKCHWSKHKNENYIIVNVIEEKTITLEKLKKRYDDNKNKISEKKQLFNATREQLIKLSLECFDILKEIINSFNLLSKIALNKSMFESEEEYIDLLIEEEKAFHETGWQTRINSLYSIKKVKTKLREVYKDDDKVLAKAGEFVEKIVNKYYDMDLDEDKIENIDECPIF